MAKINLLTIHWGMSYGAIMQTYATSKILEDAGHDVTVINLIHPNRRNYYTRFRSLFYLFKEFQFYCFKHRYFSHLSKKMYNLDFASLPKADYIVIGSDQVWNCDITGPFADHYFADFTNSEKIVSLASSFGKNEWKASLKDTEKVKSLLNRFTAISVRENSGKEILEKVFSLNASVLIDPTLAYGKFDDLVLNYKQKKQIFPFLFKQDTNAKNILKELSVDLKLPVFRFSKISFYLMNGPRAWLTNIRNSSYIVTDSFHGLAFSLIFKKNFFVLCADPKKFTRLANLLNLLGLEGRIIKSVDDLKKRKDYLFSSINYEEVEKEIKSQRQNYINFVHQYIRIK